MATTTLTKTVLQPLEDRIIVRPLDGGTEIIFEGEDLLILSSRDVLAVVKEEGN